MVAAGTAAAAILCGPSIMDYPEISGKPPETGRGDFWQVSGFCKKNMLIKNSETCRKPAGNLPEIAGNLPKTAAAVFRRSSEVSRLSIIDGPHGTYTT